MTTATTAATTAPESYLRLAAIYPPHPIRDKADYDAAAAAIDPLAVRDETTLDAGEAMYLDAVASFIEAYDLEHFASPVSPLPDRLKALIEQRGINQTRLAEAAGCGRSTVSSVIAGQREFTRDQIRRLARAFNLPADFFMA